MKNLYFLIVLLLNTYSLSAQDTTISYWFNYQLNSLDSSIELQLYANSTEINSKLIEGILIFDYESPPFAKEIVSFGDVELLPIHAGLMQTTESNNPVYFPTLMRDQDSLRFGLAFEMNTEYLNEGLRLDEDSTLLAKMKIKHVGPLSANNIRLVQEIMDRESYLYQDNNFFPADIKIKESHVIVNRELIQQNEINIFPNPTFGHLKLHIPHASGFYDLSIVDLAGNIITSHRVLPTSKYISLDISNLATGMYIIVCKSPEQVFKTKLLKQ